MYILIPYLHFIGIMALMGSLITEHLFLKPGLSKSQVKSLSSVDMIYWISIILVLVTGLLRWFFYGKGSDYYLSNPLFHTKLTLFFVLAVLSIFPTLKFCKWKKSFRNGEQPDISEKVVKSQLMFIRIELLIMAVIPMLAVLIARGSGN